MPKRKKITVTAAALAIIAVGCAVGIPRTTYYQICRFEAYQQRLAKQNLVRLAEAHLGVPATPTTGPTVVATPLGALQLSITRKQAQRMLYPKSVPFEALAPDQQRLFLQVHAPRKPRATPARPSRISISTRGFVGVILYWTADGKEVQEGCGDEL